MHRAVHRAVRQAVCRAVRQALRRTVRRSVRQAVHHRKCKLYNRCYYRRVWTSAHQGQIQQCGQ